MPDIQSSLTADNAKSYLMSIRLCSGGLSFYAYRPSVGNSFVHAEWSFPAESPYCESLKSCCLENPILLWDYQAVSIVVVSASYALVPEILFEEEKKKQLYTFTLLQKVDEVCSAQIKDLSAYLLFGIDKTLLTFCQNQWQNGQFTHSIVHQLKLQYQQAQRYRSQSAESVIRLMYVVLQEDSIDISCFSEGSLLYANSFLATNTSDKLYYILSVWKTTGFDQLKDILFIRGDSPELIEQLKTYIPHVRPIELPTDAFLYGTSFLKAPIDIISLSLCE